jgi:hypothetical protein
MVDGINKSSGINNDLQIGKLNHLSNKETKVNSSFGNGFAAESSTSINRNIAGFDFISTKFENVGFAKYERHVGQLEIDDKFFIPDNIPDNEPELAYSEC